MNLQQVANKYRISENALGSKEEGLTVISKSIREVIQEMEKTQDVRAAITKLNRLIDFAEDVKGSSF